MRGSLTLQVGSERRGRAPRSGRRAWASLRREWTVWFGGAWRPPSAVNVQAPGAAVRVVAL